MRAPWSRTAAISALLSLILESRVTINQPRAATGIQMSSLVAGDSRWGTAVGNGDEGFHQDRPDRWRPTTWTRILAKPRTSASM